ncbi:tRNA pseudouridine(38-40) synthase TruA [Saliphagus infecundisoli]|uniref:tRNA pseudouridine synthase A n=1 Tax=Saliphagus infecundisoli TaxID=1849069 RepID=A0ABD5QIU3_9EURY|nr:tRNA pseudouridine(38-40) synthase TruA [Saliphagus infecundisoli]
MRAFRIAYDGTPYYGFQRQPSVPTVEDALFDALGELSVLAEDADKPSGYAAAGRTDRGVSALAQTVALEAPDWLSPRAVNAELPADVRAWASADAPSNFHATHHASSRKYVYHLHAPPETIDDGRAERAMEELSGRHDYHNLTPDDENTDREIALSAVRDGDYLRLSARARGFSRQLVRRLVGLAAGVGRGEYPEERVGRALAPEPLPGHEGIPPAPAEPLVLAAVDYPDLGFVTDAEAAESARRVFERRRVERRTGARVAGQLRDGIG